MLLECSPNGLIVHRISHSGYKKMLNPEAMRELERIIVYLHSHGLTRKINNKRSRYTSMECQIDSSSNQGLRSSKLYLTGPDGTHVITPEGMKDIFAFIMALENGEFWSRGMGMIDLNEYDDDDIENNSDFRSLRIRSPRDIETEDLRYVRDDLDDLFF